MKKVTTATPIYESFYNPFAGRPGPSSMPVPNLNRIALFIQKLLGGPKISKLGHVTLSHGQVTPATPLRVILYSLRRRPKPKTLNLKR